jgi:hypothetical protein
VKSRIVVGLVACAAVTGGCDQIRESMVPSSPEPPSAAEVEPYYATYSGLDSIRLSGNVVEVHVEQPYDQLQRGGSLWARVGPFVYLMTPSTRSVFEAFPGVAAVRVVTHLPGGTEVARAMLRRDAMSDVLWRRTLNILGTALEGGRENPRKLEQLTEWGEEHTEFRYNPDYVNQGS